MLSTMLGGSAASAEAMRVLSVRSTLASALGIVFTAVSIFPATGAKTDADMASIAIATIMPPWAWSSEAKLPIGPGTGA